MCFSFEEITADNLERAGRGALFSCSGKVIFGSSENSGAIRELAADFGTPMGRDFIWRRQVALSSAGGGGFGGQVGIQLSEAGSFWGPGEQRMPEKELEFIFFVRHLLEGDWCLLTSWTGGTGKCSKLGAALVKAVLRRGHWGLWFCSSFSFPSNVMWTCTRFVSPNSSLAAPAAQLIVLSL